MAEVTVPMEDAGMLSSIMAEGNEPEVTREVEAEQPKTEDRDRDEKGRFVPKEAEPVKAETPKQEQATEQPKEDEAANVPSWRLREVREAREAAERRADEATRQSYATQQQMAEMRRQLEALQKPKAEPVDFFQNPDEALNQRIAPVQSEIADFKREIRLEMSRELAVIKHGQETVAEVETALEKAMRANHPDMPILSAQMRESPNPVAVAIQWHQRNKLMEITGGNPETYKQKVLEEAMKDPAFQAKVLEATRTQASTRPSTVQIPPSLNRASGSANSSADADASDMSDGSLFRHAMSSPRR